MCNDKHIHITRLVHSSLDAYHLKAQIFGPFSFRGNGSGLTRATATRSARLIMEQNGRRLAHTHTHARICRVPLHSIPSHNFGIEHARGNETRAVATNNAARYAWGGRRFLIAYYFLSLPLIKSICFYNTLTHSARSVTTTLWTATQRRQASNAHHKTKTNEKKMNPGER